MWSIWVKRHEDLQTSVGKKKQLSLSFRLSKSLNVIGTETDRSATYDLLTVVMHSNRVPISYRFRAERCKIGPWLLCNVNRKSQMAERSVSVPMTLSDLWPRFQGRDIFWSQMSQNRASYGQCYHRTLTGNHAQPFEWYHFQWPWVTTDPDFKVTFLKSNIGTKLL